MRFKDHLGAAFSGVLLLAFVVWFFHWHATDLQRIIPLGALSLGVVFGWTMRYFLMRLEKFTSNELAIVIATLIGTTVLAVFRPFGGGKDLPEEFFYYPVGLAIGFFAATIWNLFIPSGRDGI